MRIKSTKKRWASPIEENSSTDEKFVETCYRTFLERPCDPEGKKYACAALRIGLSRLEYIKSIVSSPEYYGIITEKLFGKTCLPNLKEIRPDNYVLTKNRHDQGSTVVFHAKDNSDFDWLERMIIEYGYYEQAGVWSLTIDEDKRVIAEIIGMLKPSCCLEIGCSTGAVLKLLEESGTYAEGIEISHRAMALSYPEIRRRIHFGDLLTLDLDPKYDMIIGMDVFEHLNPTKLSAYLRRCSHLLTDGGLIFTNIPAFGTDPVFGEVFPLYLADWEDASESPFSLFCVDDNGWPIHGHLIWATSAFWEKTFEIEGLKREQEIERALHCVYDGYFSQNAQARRSFFVFSKNPESHLVSEIATYILKKNPSKFCLP